MLQTPSKAIVRSFRAVVYAHYAANPRPLPWRTSDNPYHIHVSEIMLQQTQVERVKTKYLSFLQRFPDYHSLANAPRNELLTMWQGLGYNRRAIALQEAARIIEGNYGGQLPQDPRELVTLPGIGPYTAAAIAAFAFNQTVSMIETNIRTVYIHYFFPDGSLVHDRDLLPLIAATVDKKRPRDWYYALMDYGVMLKQKHGNPARRSTHYTRQTPFKGSHRQLRGELIRILLAHSPCSMEELQHHVPVDHERLTVALNQLIVEGFVSLSNNQYTISS